MISPIKIIPDNVKPFIVPALGVGALFATMEQHKNDHHKAINLGENMGAIASTVFLENIKHGLLPLVAGISMWIHTRSKKTKEEKAKSIIKDSVWLGSGLLTQKYLSGPEHNNYLHKCCSFAIGALIIAPFINDKILFRNSKKESPYFKKIKAYPISMDRYGILTKIINKAHPSSTENNNSQH